MKTGAFDSVSIREFEIRDKEETTPEKPQDPEENVALKKTAAADSTEDNSLIAAKAFDGNTKDRSSRWSSAVAGRPTLDLCRSRKRNGCKNSLYFLGNKKSRRTIRSRSQTRQKRRRNPIGKM